MGRAGTPAGRSALIAIDTSFLKDIAGGVTIDVRVIPRARRTELAGVRGAALLVRVASPPVDQAANRALVRFMAQWLEVPLRAVTLVAGDTRRDKRLAVFGVSRTAVEARVRELPL